MTKSVSCLIYLAKEGLTNLCSWKKYTSAFVLNVVDVSKDVIFLANPHAQSITVLELNFPITGEYFKPNPIALDKSYSNVSIYKF